MGHLQGLSPRTAEANVSNLCDLTSSILRFGVQVIVDYFHKELAFNGRETLECGQGIRNGKPRNSHILSHLE